MSSAKKLKANAVDVADDTTGASIPANTLRENLECPICMEVRFRGRVFQCVRGHHICALCKADETINPIKVCPTCRQGYNYPTTRSFAIESLIHLCEWEANLACMYAGCISKGSKAQMDEHYYCDHVQVPCPQRKCPKKMAVNELVQHLKIDHLDIGIWNGPPTRCLLLLPLRANQAATRWSMNLCDYDDNTFVRGFKKEPNTNLYYAWVSVLGGPLVAAMYEVEISMKGNRVEFKAICAVHAFAKREMEIVEEKECFILCEAQVEQSRVDYSGNNDIYSHQIDIKYTIKRK
jgi:hypothetical protein